MSILATAPIPPAIAHHWVIIFFVMALGACIGSFLNVVIHRLPRNLSVNEPKRSFCPSCKKQIPLSQNIPIITWIVLKGKCSSCKAPIAFRYVFVEALTMLLFLAVWLNFYHLGIGVPFALWILVTLMVAASFIDFEHQIIPDSINFGGAIVAVVLAALFPLIGAYNSEVRLDLNAHPIPNPVWYRGLFWSIVGAGVGYGIIWLVVIFGKLAFGKLNHKFDELKSFKIHQPDPDDDAILEIEGEETISFEYMFGSERDRLLIDGTDFTINDKPIAGNRIEFFHDRAEIAGSVIPMEGMKFVTGKTTKVSQPREAMGFGDVKFVMMIGAFLGWQATLFALFAGSALGAVGGLGQKWFGGEKLSKPIPFGPYLALGTLIFLFWGEQLIRWYLRMPG